MEEIIQTLRDAADKIEKRASQKIELPPAADFKTAAKKLREMMTEGRLSLTISWNEYTDGIKTSITVLDGRFKTIGEGKTVNAAVEKALAVLTPEPIVEVPTDETIDSALDEPQAVVDAATDQKQLEESAAFVPSL